MLRNLSAQLLSQLRDRTDIRQFMGQEALRSIWKGEFDSSSPEGLRQVFRGLVSSLPTGTALFCIVHGISHYEIKIHRDEL